MRYLCALIAVLTLCVPALCDENESAERVIGRLQEALETTDWQWRYIPGDVPQAKEPAFDDSSYRQVAREKREVGSEPVGWLRATIVVPEKVRGLSVAGARIVLKVGIDDEGTIFVDGKEVDDFLWDGGSAVLTENAQPGQNIVVAIRCRNSGGPLGILHARLEFERLSKIDRAVRRFIDDYRLCRQLIELQPEPKRAALTTTLVSALNSVDVGALESGREDDLLASISSAESRIKGILDLIGDLTIHLVGHAHIDMNWLWLWPETIDVCRNTFTTACKLMDEFPDFVFSQSQPATYLAMQENAPEVVSKIKERIERGQWDAVATTWTESDTNMASGESIVRSILYGKRYMRQQFGVESEVCWMPDTFGHVWTLPQILAKSGIKYYCFMRCNPGHTLFWWQGPDGSRVLAYSRGYSSGIEGGHLLRDAMSFASETKTPHFMHVYGVGDHGGGPTRAMLEKARQLQANPSFPRMKFSSVGDYFRAALLSRSDYPVWNTELNTAFEGCYTTHADIKRWNRECENLIPAAEKFSALAIPLGAAYPRAEFEQSWRNTGFNQFHDLLCGSAIHGSYDYSRTLYEKATEQAKAALDHALDTLAEKITTKGTGIPIIVFNPLGWTRTDVVVAPSPFPGDPRPVAVHDSSGNIWPARNTGDKLVFTARNVPALGYRVFWVRRKPKPLDSGIKTSAATIENQFFRVKVDPDTGVIRSIYDKANKRELVPAGGAAALLQVLMERPHGMSAWTIGPIESSHDLTGQSEVVLMDSGPAKATLTIDQEYADSQFTLSLSLYDGVPRIDLSITADWQELGGRDKLAPMLKIAFFTTLKKARATFNIPFGSIQRPTNGAEVPALKWIDLSEANYGLSLLNNCKYGFDVKGSTMRATLLRASYEPDPTPDQGIHEMTFSLYPHKGDWRIGGTVRRAFELNEPLIPRVVTSHAGSLPSERSFVSVSMPNVILTALKQAEDDDSLILRFYEAHGVPRTAQIKLKLPAEYAVETDLLERPIGKKIAIKDGSFAASFGKHEIKTFKLLRK